MPDLDVGWRVATMKSWIDEAPWPYATISHFEVALLTALSAAGAAGTECADAGYARQRVDKPGTAGSYPEWTATDASGNTSNDADLSFGPLATEQTLVGYRVWAVLEDTSKVAVGSDYFTGGNETVAAGRKLELPAGSLDWTW